jgi:RNA polymerase sigma factor (sigma-70 family)
MVPDDADVRLSELKTFWTLLFRAHQGPGDQADQARRDLLLRYYGAAYRYLRGILGDADAAVELAQEFAVAFLRGDFRHADPGRGRFRDYLKACLRYMAHKYLRRRRREPGRQPLPAGDALPAPPTAAEEDAAFLEAWRQELLARAWEALEQADRDAGTPCHAVLSLKTQHPELRSAELAARLSERLGRALSEAAYRQALRRARQAFAELLLAEVSRSLGGPTEEELERELIELRLLSYCREALRRQPGGA